jgi:hypothetical protein
MNAMHDYVLSMKGDEMPPATAFWSAPCTIQNTGFFIPNDRKKYSVGENGGMKLDADGGIAIYVSAEQPENVPVENWLPLNRGDYGIDVIMRLYAPDLGRYQNWSAPKAEKLSYSPHPLWHCASIGPSRPPSTEAGLRHQPDAWDDT